MPPQLTRCSILIPVPGPSHERMYSVGCYINNVLIAEARGQSFADAQMGASLRANEALFLDDGPEQQQQQSSSQQPPQQLPPPPQQR